MKVAITSQNKKHITGHAGKCRKFWIYDIDEATILSKELLEIPREHVFHGYKGADHPIYNVDVLLSGGMGNGLRARLARQNVQALIVKETEPDTAISKLLDKTLEVFVPDPNHHCNHHGEGHWH